MDILTGDLIHLFSNAVSVRRKSYKANEWVFRQGEPVQGIFAIEEGQVRLERNTIEGRAAIMQVAGNGESFAEAALFSDTYHCDAIATLPSQVVVFPKVQVLNALRDHPHLAVEYIAHLSAQVRTLRERLELRSILSARERILQYLLLYVDANTNIVRVPGTIKELAAELGLAHEGVYRELKKLEAEGLIQRENNTILIRSPRR